MPCQPRMLEPSNPRPSSKTLSSSLPTGIVKCCEVPRRSVNRRSTALTSFSRHRARTSRGVMGMPEVRGRMLKEKERETKAPPAPCCYDLLVQTTHILTTHLFTYLINNIS